MGSSISGGDPFRPFRVLAERVHDLVWVVRSDGEICYANARWNEFTSWNQTDSSGSPWHQVVHPDDQAEWLREWGESVRDGSPCQAELRLRNGQGVYVRFRVQAEPVLDEHGAATYWFGICSEISDYKLLAPHNNSLIDERPGPKRLAPAQLDQLWSLIEERMGVCPSFFKLASADPAIAEGLFDLAQFAYLDSPIPSAFKEKLFTYLSRFCPVRYCLARHAAFLAGRGYIAGDADSPALSPAAVAQIVSEPLPHKNELPALLKELESLPAAGAEWPEFESRCGILIRVACSEVFLHPQLSTRWTSALRRLLGPQRYEQLMLFMAFVRTAHFWTEVHPELRLEDDVETLLAEHEALTRSLLGDGDEAARASLGASLLSELNDLRHASELSKALRESEARFDAIVERMPIALGVADAAGRLLMLNPAGLELYGLRSCDEFPLSLAEYRERFELASPDGLPLPVEQWPLARALRGEYVSDFEARLTRRSGGAPHILSYSVLPLGVKEGVMQYLFVALDITRNKSAEQALRSTAEQLRSSQETFFGLIQNSPLGIYIVDADFRLRQVSAGAQKVFSNVQPLLDRDFEEVLRIVWPEPFASEAIKIFRNTLETGEPFHSPDTTEQRGDVDEVESYDWQIQRIRLPDGSFGVVCYFYDLTPQRRAEWALRKSEDRLRSAAEAAQFGVYDINLTNGKVYWSPEAKRLFGLPPDAAVPDRVGDPPDFVHPQDRAQVLAAFQSSLTPDSDGLKNEHRIILPNGETRWILVQGRTIFEGEGAERRAVRASGTFVDISNRKQLEDELRQVAAALSDANRRKDEFLAILAHELRNPLAPIRTGLELMKGLGTDPVKLEEVREAMERQTAQLMILVEDLLDVSRITRGKLQLRKTGVNLAEVVEASIECCRPLLDKSGHKLTVDMPSAPVELFADPTRLEQILSNLLNNAIKYTPAGGSIRLTCKERGGEVEIKVKDNGVGIPADLLPQVFEMFAQVGRSDKQNQGLGIGLTLVKSLVELHGGEIEAHSEGPGRGSEFAIRLPSGSPELSSSPDAEPADTAAGPRRKVLIVDDNNAATELLGMLVEKMGHEVRTAQDGAEAVVVAGEFGPNVILMDLGMPGMNGYEAAAEIRRQRWGQGIRLIALSGWGQTDDRRRSKEAGFDDHLVKPVGAAALRKIFHQLDDPPA